ncbi:MAG: helix-hairpin-helix domain-containing protein [Bacteroidales bacterium]|nr:helix-hairpin-helix domain-containing protein [Bacteroidales bacterium]MDD4821146.1 helix-hairpin-helix domain-containing protein [Bacteroidales bacterium]
MSDQFKGNSLFGFSRGERAAILLLLILIAIIILVRYAAPGRKEVLSNESKVLADSVKRDTVSLPRHYTYTKTRSYKSSQKEYIPIQREKKSKHDSSWVEYPGKYSKGTVLNINLSDTLQLMRVPGIGSAFANRIVKYRELLGGYHDVQQLRELYGMTEERYASLVSWFVVENDSIRKIQVNKAPFGELLRHPYLSMEQTKIIVKMRERKGHISSLDEFALYDLFNDSVRGKLEPYLSF